MRPFHPPRPNHNHPHRARPGADPGPPPFPAAPMHPGFQPPVPNLAAANPMAAAAAANPFLALQLMGQAQQLQNLCFLAAALQQQQQPPPPPPFFPGGFPPNPNQFAPYPGHHAGFNGGGAFQHGGAGVCGPRPPRPMMNPAGRGFNNTVGVPPAGAPRPMLNAELNDRISTGGSNIEVKYSEIKVDGISDFSPESGGRNKTSDQIDRSNAGRDGRGGRQFGSRGRGRGMNFNPGRGRGSNNWRETNSNFRSHESPPSGRCHDISSPAAGGRRKRPPIIYDANEVKQWLEARKKNYPTSDNVNKKLSQSQAVEQNKDEEAQVRRQELKEVLAKQKELGFELPELPPGYLSETEDRDDERKSKWNTPRRGSRFDNRGGRNSKRQRFDRGDSRSKRPKVRDNTSGGNDATPKSRKPTLLQKLLSSDIKRDRHRLLHTFKFMVMNNFFKDWPDKPLEFPSVKVNQIEIDNNIPADDLDDLQDAETIKDGDLDLKENGDGNELTSIDGENGSVDHNEQESEDGTSSESSDEDGNQSASEEVCDESEEDVA